MTPLPLQPDNVFLIDNSSMEMFTTCPRQAYLYIIRRKELSRSRIALDFGGSFHDVLKRRYTIYDTNYLNTAEIQDLLTYAASLPLNPPEDDYRTSSYLVDACTKYFNDYPAEAFSLVRLPNGSSAVEVPFTFPLGTVESSVYGKITVMWTGRLDLVYRSQGKLGVMDHKTTSIGGPQYFAEFEIAHQMYGYVHAVEYIFNERCHEICINGLVCRKPTKTGQKFEFSRHIIPVDRDLLDEWHSDSLAIVSDFIAHCERGYFPKHTKWCVGKYGPCQYRGVCTSPPGLRETVLSTSEFRSVTWSPLT